MKSGDCAGAGDADTIRDELDNLRYKFVKLQQIGATP